MFSDPQVSFTAIHRLGKLERDIARLTNKAYEALATERVNTNMMSGGTKTRRRLARLR
jgi:hypothetical protein